jgi:hypothetical protein
MNQVFVSTSILVVTLVACQTHGKLGEGPHGLNAAHFRECPSSAVQATSMCTLSHDAEKAEFLFNIGGDL